MLERFRSRAAGARAPGIEFLGRGDAPGRACFFFRAGDSDIVLECVPREQASRCCREGGRVAVVSHVFPSTGAPEGIGPSIPWLAGRPLEREGDILADIRSHVDDELPASSGADVPLGGGRLGFVRIGPRGTLCLDLAAWSFRLLPPASGAEDDRAVQAALLALPLASLFGAVVGVIIKLRTKESVIAFGPYLALGALLCLFWMDHILAFLFGL